MIRPSSGFEDNQRGLRRNEDLASATGPPCRCPVAVAQKTRFWRQPV